MSNSFFSKSGSSPPTSPDEPTVPARPLHARSPRPVIPPADVRLPELSLNSAGRLNLPSTVPWSTLIKRINRRLAPTGLVLRTSRGLWRDLGEHYLLDLDMNAVVQSDVSLEELGHELGALGLADKPA